MSNWKLAPDLSLGRARLVLAVCCLLLLVESVALIHSRWVEDESWLAAESWSLVTEGRIHMPAFPFDRLASVDVAEPVHRLAEAASFKTLGIGVAPARLVSALSGIATVIVAFTLGLELAGPWCAAIAALFTATDLFLVVASRTARPEAATTLLCWLAVWLLWRGARSRSAVTALLAGICGGLSILCHPLGVPFAICLALFLLIHYGAAAWKQPVFWAFAAGGILPFVPYLLWCFSDAAHVAAFRSAYIGTGEASPSLYVRFLGELTRWSDFIGLGNQRIALPVPVPVRLHVALILLFAIAAMFRTHRKIAAPVAALLAANLLWWWYMPNKGPRYVAVVTPLFGIALGCLVAGARSVRVRKLVLAAVALVVLTQMAGSAYWIYKYRTADYARLTRDLRRVIPPGASVYAVSTFWMALYDHPYYAYDRTPLDLALARLRPQYLILHDRVMEHGSGHGADDFGALRAQLTDFVRDHAALAGTVSNPFYGDLQIYRVAY